ncbi:sensor histidine kinase [Halpernia frigidisoli]|uniref:histidine kinase n=1 Tax=Halpernia frigidisoli TaxID=1125876 RepID=A0A1I3I029_9FLAO|nr:ATP-binding protein [Halpernia frigidisoli]SFI41355.1 Histidine kinase-, DNA gyrase B-, and HSP90-like ATPase [Halpernia frigidisoli]
MLTLKNSIISKKEIKSESVSNIIEEVREISRNLYPVILEKVGLEESVKSLAENFSNETTLFVTTEINYQNKVEKNKELHLYRIIQEALNNTLKHGNATIAKIKIVSDENFLHLSVKDNGEGFDVASKTKSKDSFGLQGIKQRAQAMSANLDLKSDDSGTEILIKMAN